MAGMAHRSVGSVEEAAQAGRDAVGQTAKTTQDDAGGDDLHGASVDRRDEALGGLPSAGLSEFSRCAFEARNVEGGGKRIFTERGHAHNHLRLAEHLLNERD